MALELLKNKCIGQDGEAVEISEDTDIVGLYFSAHWCPPCRGFTPLFADYYKKEKDSQKLEVVFVSSDRDQPSFDEYFAEMPWKALKYEERGVKEELAKKYDIKGIPSLVVLDKKTGDVIESNARGKVQNGQKIRE